MTWGNLFGFAVRRFAGSYGVEEGEDCRLDKNGIEFQQQGINQQDIAS